MSNPFKKRATEFFVDDESFLAAVTPSPINFFLSEDRDRLYDRLVVISGTPGSGKTTLARLFQYRTVTILLNHIDIYAYREIAASLTDCGMLRDGRPMRLTCRVPLGGEYRDFWEFPYTEEIRTGLLESMLQARTCLAWVQNLRAAGHLPGDVKIIVRDDAVAATESIGLESLDVFYEKARAVELAIYRISAALVPPAIESFSPIVTAPYRPFDVIEMFEVTSPSGTYHLRPLVIFDDVHELHSVQFDRLQSWLVRRGLRVSRWIMTRLDALSPKQVLKGTPSRVAEDLKRVQTKRDITEIRFQSDGQRSTTRKNFQKMARDMSTRYIRMMPVFDRRGVSSMSPILRTEPPVLSNRNMAKLQDRVERDRIRLGIAPQRRAQIQKLVAAYAKGTRDPDVGDDVQLAMERVLLHRFANRMPNADLFDSYADAEPIKPLKCDSAVAHGAQIHLMHDFGRPYYYGMNALCDSGSNNAELFLQIAEGLVAQAETKIIRNRSVSLSPHEQHRLLRKRGDEIIKSWAFPECDNVRALIEEIAEYCTAKTREPNAPLGAGANAVGIPQSEFYALPEHDPRLARILQFGVAYNTVTLVPRHMTKNKVWCLIELGGASILHYGLPFYRGGFIEGSARDLSEAISMRKL